MKAHDLGNPYGIAPKRAGMPSPLWAVFAPTRLLAALLLSGLFTLGLSGQAQAQQETLSLVCDPCTATKSAPTSISITAGVRNSGNAASGNLQLAIGAFPSPQSESGVLVASVPLSSIPRSSSVASKEYTTGFKFPSSTHFGADGNTHLIIYLRELVTTSDMGVLRSQWTTRDLARLSPSQPLANPPAGGESTEGLYIEGTPSVDTTTTAGMATVTIPKLVNGGGQSITLTAGWLWHSTGRDLFRNPVTNSPTIHSAMTSTLSLTLVPGASAENVSFSGNYTAPDSGTPYTHLSLNSTDGIRAPAEVWINVRNDSGTALPNTNFTANTIDFLNDEDADGATDHSETLAGTDPAQAASKPDDLNIDLMVLYTAEMAAAQSNDPLTRIMRDVTWANTALENSGIDARYRVTGHKQVTYTEPDFNKMLTAMEDQTAPFVGIDAEREAAGADLLVLYTQSRGTNNRTCGLASTPGLEREGDMAFYSRVRVVAAVSAPCHTSILAHELGHNLGLGHSERQGSIGTWEWSRGHGVVNSFVTVMAYAGVHRVGTGNTKQIYSNPDKSECGSGANGSGTAACGVARTMPKAADATRSVKATMFQIAQLSDTPPDTDGDDTVDALDTDDDNDGLTDEEEAILGTNPLLADTDGDNVNDMADAFPLDMTEWIDEDDDGVGHNTDVDDSDPSVQQPPPAASLSLVCGPCSAAKSDATGVSITAGVSNSGNASSGNLRLSLVAQPTLQSGTGYVHAASVYLSPVAGGGSVASEARATGFNFPPSGYFNADGNTHLVLHLQEYDTAGSQWVSRDYVRLSSPQPLVNPPSGGESQGGIYLVGTPTVDTTTIAGTARITIPRLVNGSGQSIILTSGRLWHSTGRDLFNNPVTNSPTVYRAMDKSFSSTLAPGEVINNWLIIGDYSPPSNIARDGLPYTHLAMHSANRVEVWVNVENRSGTTLPDTGFSVSSIDFLADGDGDGATDHSETLAGTDPTQAVSKPGTLSMDLLVLYTAEVAAAQNDDPLPRITQHVEWANTALRNSGIDARYRVARTREVSYTERDYNTMLTAMQEQTAPFVGIDAERAAAGADLLVLYTQSMGADNQTCGLATLTGLQREGDLAFRNRASVVSALAAGCHASTLAHELGHNLGLGHSALQRSVGTWEWSRGHGVVGSFVTVMGYASAFNVATNRIQGIYSTPAVSTCGASGDQPCGVARSMATGADAVASIKATMFQVAQFSADPFDTDGDGMTDDVDTDDDNDGLTDTEEATHTTDPKNADTDGDGLSDGAEVNTHTTDPKDDDHDDDGLSDGDEVNIHNTDPKDDDDDNDGLSDGDEVNTYNTDPKKPDTDDDGVNDNTDAFPRDGAETADADGDGTGDNSDVLPNDASVSWTRTLVTVHQEGTVAANIIATFDDTTDDPAAIHADTSGKYSLESVNALGTSHNILTEELGSWNLQDGQAGVARVGGASVSTCHLNSNLAASCGTTTTGNARAGVKIRDVTISGDYINFLMAGGDGSADVGIKLFETDTRNELAAYKPNACNDRYLKGNQHWRHFDVTDLQGRQVDIEIYDNSREVCGHVSFDHIYQGDTAQGTLAGTAQALTIESNVFLHCPCGAERTAGGASVTLTAGVENLGDESTNALRLLLAALPDPADKTGAVAATHSLAALAADGTVAQGTEHSTAFTFPGAAHFNSDSQTHLFIVLQEEETPGDWQERDRERLAPTLATGANGAIDAGSIDFLTDTDDDGVPDYSERLIGTDPAVSNTHPMLTLDLMVLYTPAMAEAQNDDPLTIINRDIAWANVAFRNSGVNARYRLAAVEEVNYDESGLRLFTETLMAMAGETGVFAGLDARRAAAGADMLALYMAPLGEFPICGQATLDSHARGDLARTVRSSVQAALTTHCGALTLAHELGHNMGLGHSAKSRLRGTWPWAQGHGVRDSFVTIMAYAFNFAAPKTPREQLDQLELQRFSDPSSSACKGQACGVAVNDAGRTNKTAGANSVLAIESAIYQLAALSPSPLDTDGDDTVDLLDLDDDGDGVNDDIDAFPLDASESVDTDGDMVGDNADALPNDPDETVDMDGDGVGANADANDMDASVDWTRTNVTLPVDATVAANLIATFDDTTEDPATIRAGGCPADARYQVTFTSQWNANSHGNSPPYPAGRGPHFTSLVGSTHNSQVTFWQRGQLATPGIESIAEIGGTSTFRNTDQANARAAGNAGAYLSLGGLGAYPSSATRQIDVSEDFPLLTLASMIAPTPDWFVGVSGFNLKEGSRGCWKRRITENLVGNDAGTETGTGYSLGNPAETTHKPIGPITALPQAVRNNPFATLSLVLQAGDGSSGSGTGKYQVTGVFADASLASWNDFDSEDDAARVGDASVSTWQIGTTTNAAATGSIKINGVTIAGDYLNFLMAGGNGSVDVGVQVLAAGTTTMLAEFKPNACTDRYLKGDNHWRHIDVSALAGQSVDILIFDNDSASNCGFVAFDHFYQSDSLQGTLADTASPDSDGDGVIDRLDAFPNDRTETADSDGDGVGDNADAFPNDSSETVDTDGDGVGDNADVFPNDRTETADSDGDGVGDNADAFPNDPDETVDADGDRVGANADANDNDASVTWTRTNVTLPVDATVATNLIATFDDATEDLAAIRQDATKYTLAGVFANASLASWNDFDSEDDAARVGDASVSTWQIGTTTNAAATGTIKINGVTLAGDYLNFLMAGGNGSVDVGVQVLAAGTTTMLAEFKPNACTDRYLKGDSHWRHIDVSALAGQSVDILIFDNDSASNCGFVAFDHFYQSDSLQGALADTASPDSDGDGVIDRLDAFPNDRTETADSDGDGVGDNADVFPNDRNETTDSDGDGVGDNADAFPNDRTETVDTDGDGVGDNADAFPNDRTETVDTDGDGVGDNADVFPNDRTETADSDGDGVGDNADAFPNDRTETVDTDMDGTGNNTDPDDDGDGVVDEKDFEPLDEEVAFDDRSFGVNLVLKADAVNAANVIASFEYPVDMQSDDRFILTGLFADPDLAADGWNIFEIEGGGAGASGGASAFVAPVAAAAPASTFDHRLASSMDTLTSQPFDVDAAQPYLTLLLAGSDSEADVGVRVLALDGSVIAEVKLDSCAGIVGDEDWTSIDLRAHVGNRVIVQLFNNDRDNPCGFISFDHIHMSSEPY